MESDSERILHNGANLLLRTAYANKDLTRQELRNQVEILANATKFRDKRPSSTTIHKQEPIPIPLWSATRQHSNAELHVAAHQKTQEEVVRVLFTREQASTTKVAEEVLSDAL